MNGTIKSPLDLRDYTLAKAGCKLCEDIELPTTYRLDWNVPIYHQGDIGSCASHACAETKSYIENDLFSIGYLHGNRETEEEYESEGQTIRAVMAKLCDRG